MKILVIDDSGDNQAAARAQLKDHDTTVVGSYDEGQNLVGMSHRFDVVLVDLLMPASRQMQGPRGMGFVGEEMPIGIFLALLAAKNGAKRVAVFTDSDHHVHPASACLDAFNEGEGCPTPFTVAGAQMILSNTRGWVNNFRPENLTEEMSYEEYGVQKKPSVRAKNWRELLGYLIKCEPKTDDGGDGKGGGKTPLKGKRL
ncbi:MAG: hypothetical protein Q8L24_00365 [bacterium]|nr:hypothetical protein [bacterium]